MDLVRTVFIITFICLLYVVFRDKEYIQEINNNLYLWYKDFIPVLIPIISKLERNTMDVYHA